MDAPNLTPGQKDLLDTIHAHVRAGMQRDPNLAPIQVVIVAYPRDFPDNPICGYDEPRGAMTALRTTVEKMEARHGR